MVKIQHNQRGLAWSFLFHLIFWEIELHPSEYENVLGSSSQFCQETEKLKNSKP